MIDGGKTFESPINIYSGGGTSWNCVVDQNISPILPDIYNYGLGMTFASGLPSGAGGPPPAFGVYTLPPLPAQRRSPESEFNWVLYEMIGFEDTHRLEEAGVIEIAPLAYMRGRTLSNAFVVLDEAQNTTVGQMKMFLTRLGENSTMVVTGDPTQSDLEGRSRTGFDDALRRLRGFQGIAVVEFSTKDIVRHPLVEQIVNPVRWAQSCAGLPRGDDLAYHEMAPGAVLRGLMRRIDRGVKVAAHDEP